MKIEPFAYTDQDYAGLVELNRLLDPEIELSIDLLRKQEQEFTAKNQVVRVQGKLENQIVASGVYWHSLLATEDPYHFAFSVHPDYQASAGPGQMQNYLLASIEQAQATAIVCQLKEDEQYRTRLLVDAQFELKMRFPRSRLDVAILDTNAYHDQMTLFVEQGIQFVTLTDVMNTDPDWQRNVWRMFTIIEQDVPSPEPVQTTPFEEYAEYYTDDWFRPDSWTIAVDSTLTGAQRYVGMCVVNIMSTRPDSLFAGITGVVPSYRRRKIATILKVCSAKYAQQNGYRYIYTDNEENNPMYGLNLQLGFEPLPALVYYKKQVS